MSLSTKQAALYIGGAAFLTGVLILLSLPRGIRNNNPLNIRKGNDWNGETAVSTDKDFETFKHPVWGFRAAARIVRNYYNKHGLTTIREIVSRWAPPSENITSAYVDKVAQKLGVSPDEQLDLEDKLPKLLQAMAHHENGGNYYNLLMIKAGIKLA